MSPTAFGRPSAPHSASPTEQFNALCCADAAAVIATASGIVKNFASRVFRRSGSASLPLVMPWDLKRLNGFFNDGTRTAFCSHASCLLIVAAALDGNLRRLLRPVRSPQLTVIGIGQVESSDRVVRQHSIFGDQHRSQPRGVVEKQAVMPDAEAEHDIKLAAGTLEQFGLAYRVADRLKITGTDFLLVLDAEFFLWDAAVLACDRSDLEPVTLEDAAQDLGVIDKTNAGRDAYFLKTHSLGKLTNLLDARPLAVARCLDHGRDLGNAPN